MRSGRLLVVIRQQVCKQSLLEVHVRGHHIITYCGVNVLEDWRRSRWTVITSANLIPSLAAVCSKIEKRTRRQIKYDSKKMK